MHAVASLADLRQARRAAPAGAFGLVLALGPLHPGHLSLVRQARADCDHVGVGLLAEPAPLSAVERPGVPQADLDRALALLQPLDVDLVWAPAPEDLYPADFRTWVTVERVSAPLEGKHRPGYFRAVATLVAKLLNAFTPDRVYLGQHHAQQVVVVRQMVRDLNYPVQVVVCPTLREPDGLAVSSHNLDLGPAERQAATVLYRALQAAQQAFQRGERDAEMLRAIMSSAVAAEPLAREEYVSVADPDSLDELAQVERGALLSLAVRLGSARLTDNLFVG